MVNESETSAQEQQSLRVLVKGFAGFDMRLLEGAVKLSKRRNPSLELVDDSSADAVDVVLIDGKDTQAVVWSQQNQSRLAGQAVVWVDYPQPVPVGHTSLKRPVQWTNLHIILSRSMDDASYGVQAEPAAQAPSAASAALAAAQASASSPAAVPASAPAASMAQLSTSGTVIPSILVVDDSAAVRGHLDSALKAVGYNVQAVDSGEAALIALETGAHFDCILMDVLMPGMDGYETCRKVKAMSRTGVKKPPIVMLTSKSSPFDKIRGKMAGCDAYLTKPVQKSHLMQVLSQFVFKNQTLGGG